MIPKRAKLISVLIVDDSTSARTMLRSLVESDPSLAVMGVAQDAYSAVRLMKEQLPDVILLDNHMPGVNGVDALAGFKAVAPQARVLMLTVSEDERDLAAALRGGARGYLLKTMDSEMLASAIQRTMAGESVVSPEMTSKLVNAFQSGQGTTAPLPPAVDTDPIHSLSPREREILALIAKGASNKELARELNIAEATVKIHVQHILRKLNLSSRVQAAVYLAGRQW